ncbi:unnamed protein product [Arabidopsis halleri]
MLSLTPQTIFKYIDRDIKNIITSRREKRLFHRLMPLWLRRILP